jgi:hypothetical protein
MTQQLSRTHVASVSVSNHLGKHGRISQPKVEPLPRYRMQRLRGVPDQHGASRYGFHRAGELQRIRNPPTNAHEPSGAPSEPRLQLAQITAVIQRQNTSRIRRPARPDNAVAPIVERQYRERSGRSEPLIGSAIVRTIGPNVGNNRDLIVVLYIGFDRRSGTNHGVSPVGRHKKACLHALPDQAIAN